MSYQYGRPRAESRKGKTTCLKCSKSFVSDDRISIRICNTCKSSDAWRGSQKSDALLGADGNIMSIPTDAEVGNKKPRTAPTLGRATKKGKKA